MTDLAIIAALNKRLNINIVEGKVEWATDKLAHYETDSQGRVVKLSWFGNFLPKY